MRTLILLLALATQDPCPNSGSRFVRGFVEHGPALGCAFAESDSSWTLVTPSHHEASPHEGFTPVEWREVPRLFVRYRCTGLWFAPRVLAEIKTLGYVIEVSERRCS